LLQEQEARSEKQEQFRRSQSPHFLSPPSLFAFYLLYSMDDSITHSNIYSSDVIGGINPVTIDSSICSDNNHNDYEEAFSEESPSKKIKAYNKINAEKSWIWSHFKKMEEKKEFAFCDLCMKEVYYSKDYSTSMLIWHIKRHHKDIYKHHLKSKAEEKLSEEGKGDAQGSIKPFLITCPSFEQSLITWMISTYQPLHCCEEKSFREMCFSLNEKCPILSRES